VMTFRKFGQMNKNQRGFTLIELLIVIAILGILGGGVAMATIQVLGVNAMSVGRMTAVKEIENGVHWITNDAMMAQRVNAGAPSGFPLTMTWIEWNGTSNNVTYSVQNGQLQRSHSVNGGPPTNTMVIRHLNTSSNMTNCQSFPSLLSFKITVTIGGFKPASETRLFEVLLRAAI
jgi:prepilin-type N-terminal cleavage/methylation domain-containing protein